MVREYSGHSKITVCILIRSGGASSVSGRGSMPEDFSPWFWRYRAGRTSLAREWQLTIPAHSSVLVSADNSFPGLVLHVLLHLDSQSPSRNLFPLMLLSWQLIHWSALSLRPSACMRFLRQDRILGPELQLRRRREHGLRYGSAIG